MESKKQISEDLIKKIKALLDKAKSTDSQAEAESFIAHANKLLLQYNLDMSSVENLSQKAEVEQDEQVLMASKEHGTYDRLLLKVLCKYNFIQVVTWVNEPEKFTLIGERQNIDITMYLFEYLKQQLPKVGNKIYTEKVKETRRIYTIQVPCNNYQSALNCFNEDFPELDLTKEDIMPLDYTEGKFTNYTLKNLKKANLSDRPVYLRSFLIGAAKGLAERLETERQEIITQSVLNSTALTVSVKALIKSKEDANKAFMDKSIGKTQFVSSRLNATDKTAFESGKETGKNIPLNKGLTNTSISQKVLS